MCQGAGKAGEAQKDRGKQQPVMHLGVCVCANELAIVTASECLKSNLRRRVDKFVCTNWYNKRQPAKRGNVRKDSRINTQMKMGKSALRKIFTFILVHFLLATHVHVSSYCWYCWQSISPACIPATLSNCSTYFFTHSFQFHFVTVKSLILSKFHTHTCTHMNMCAFTGIYIWIFKLHIYAIFGLREFPMALQLPLGVNCCHSQAAYHTMIVGRENYEFVVIYLYKLPI